jgi:predicted esterase
MRRGAVVATFAAATAYAAPHARAGPKTSPVPAPLVLADAERAALDRAARAPQGELRIGPSPAGRLGAWLVVGPYRSSTWDKKQKPPGADALEQAPPGVDETQIAPRLGQPFGRGAPRWVIASSGEGAIDVKSALHATESDIIGYAAGTLHVARAGRYYLLLGTDDGVRVNVDGRTVLTRDEARPERDDDDLVPLDLAAGDHALVLKLHQRDGAWSFHARVVDGELGPPAGAYLALPGTSEGDARDLATKMSWVSVDRGVQGGDYRPRLTVRFPEGAPRGVPLPVTVRLTRPGAAPIVDAAAGEVPLDAAGAGELAVALPRIAPDLVEDKDWTFEVDVAGRLVKAPFHPRRTTREAIGAAERALAEETPWLAQAGRDSVLYLKERLSNLASRGDADLDAQAHEARELADAARAIAARTDPFAARTGPVRRAYRSIADGELHELAVYVPPGAGSGQKRPLVIALHGLNGKPMAMLRWAFGGDEAKKDQEWEDRHVYDFAPLFGRGPAGPLDAFVVAPTGHGNTMYRDVGEDDVMRALEWAMRELPVDPARVTITGPSMGGIGTAAIAFRYPDRFAAAEPLCGYHSYFVRRDFVGRPIRPWERFLGEERSNVFWAENGDRTPLYVVHGTQDLPESNSGVLIEKYEDLKYSVEHEHPALGHNVWQTTYSDLKGLKWLLKFRRDLHPKTVHFKTLRLRADSYAWVHVGELEKPDGWGELRAAIKSRSRVEAKTSGVTEVRFDRDDVLLDATKPVAVAIDGASLDYDGAEEIVLHKEDGTWQKGRAVHDRPWKRGGITGPLRDVFHWPLLFVYGADDKTQTRANEEVARAFASIRGGVTVRYPMMSDAEFFARGEALANERGLVLVGNARSNRVVRALEKDFPIRIDGDAVILGGQRITGTQLGAAFVRPNPRRPDRYVAVIEGIDALGTWRALSLPDIVPDFVVYDAAMAPSRGQMLLSAGSVRAAGFFQNDWSLPASFADPLAHAPRPAAKSEYDATPYLP